MIFRNRKYQLAYESLFYAKEEITLEGGNAFKDVVRIKREYVDITIKELGKIIGETEDKILERKAGSTGKTETSGDIDLLFDKTEYDKKELFLKLKEKLGEDSARIIGTLIAVRFPIYKKPEVPTNTFVQIDLIFSDSKEFAKWYYASNEPAPLKGLHRNILMSNLVSVLLRDEFPNSSISFNGFTYNKKERKFIRDIDKIAKIIFNNNSAKAEDLSSVLKIVSAMKKYLTSEQYKKILERTENTVVNTLNKASLNEFLLSKNIKTEGNEGDRVGIQHLYSLNKPENYSMDFNSFKKLITELEKLGGKITVSNSSISEKFDGMALKMGINEKGFYMQSSYSGKIYDKIKFKEKIKYIPAQKAFFNSFDDLKQIFISITKNKFCEVQFEWLYTPMAKQNLNDDKVYFNIVGYEKNKIGKHSTFIILKVESKEINPTYLKNALIKSSTNEIKFLSADLNIFSAIDLSAQIKKAKKAFKIIEEKQLISKINKLKGKRKAIFLTKRRELKEMLLNLVLPIQKEMYEVILLNIKEINGILGDIEGYVIQIGEIIFKVNNPNFMATKFEI